MNSKHTPGPWAALNNGGLVGVSYPGGAIIVAGTNKGEPPFRVKANALLIAASPLMLKALEMVATQPGFEPNEPYGKAVVSAIAKARGES